MAPTNATGQNLLSQLKVIAETSVGNSVACPLGRIAIKLDEETREALFDALRSEASTMSIYNALKQEGIAISRESITKHRKCFTEPNDKKCLCYPNNTETNK